MKKLTKILLCLVIATTLLASLSACGTKEPSVASIKAKYENAGYTVTAPKSSDSENEKFVDGFLATKSTGLLSSVIVTVTKYQTEETATEMANVATVLSKVSQQGKYVCTVANVASDNETVENALKIFDNCF